MKRQELHDWAIRHGYAKDHFGYLTKTVAGDGPRPERTYRLKLSQCSVRKEVRSNGQWIRLRSAYLRDCSLNEKDQLQGLTANGCTPKPVSKLV